MWHLPTGFIKAPSAGLAVADTAQEDASTAAAAVPVPPAPSHHHMGANLVAAIGHVHIALPPPRPHYPKREPIYFESARTKREMDHL